jgi:hypothetical protein
MAPSGRTWLPPPHAHPRGAAPFALARSHGARPGRPRRPAPPTARLPPPISRLPRHGLAAARPDHAVPALPRCGSPPSWPPGPSAASPRPASRPHVAPGLPARPWRPSARWRARPRSPPCSLLGASTTPSPAAARPWRFAPAPARPSPPWRVPLLGTARPPGPVSRPGVASPRPGPAPTQRDPGVATAQRGPGPAWLRLARPQCPCMARPPARGSAPACARFVRGASGRPCTRARARVVRVVLWHGSPCPRSDA